MCMFMFVCVNESPHILNDMKFVGIENVFFENDN